MAHRGFSSRIFHSPLGQNDRQRDIFPLPALHCSGGLERNVSRCVQRRIQRRDHTVRQVNKAITALNSLYYGVGKAYGRVAVADVSQPPLLQKDAIDGIFDQVRCLGAPPKGACYSGALAALRVASSGYAEVESGIGEVVKMDLLSLSLPSGKVAGVDLGVSLDGDLREVVMNFEDHMLQEPGNWMDLQDIASSIKTYDDPILRRRPGYLKFLKRLYDAGVLDFTSTCRGRVGAFAVSKKPKYEGGKRIDRQRLVLDCRATNLQFKPPPMTRLGSLASLGEMELPNGETPHMAGADIKDCFYGCKCPPGLQDFFCLKSDVTLDEVAFITGGRKFDFLGWPRICPCISVLPMGFNWSFYLIQALHEQISLRALGVSNDWLVRDSHPPPLLHGKQVATMPYCDNVHWLSLDPRSCQDGVERINGELTLAGFELHEEVSATSFFPTLGGEVDGEQGAVRPTKERVWNLILAFEYVAQASKVSPGLIQRLLGHSMVVCVLHRAGMSVFRYLYDFVHNGDGPRALRPSEVHECKIFAGILPLLYSNMRRTITCTDASPEGYGICSLDAGCDVARSLGCWQERWRFRRLAPEEWKPRARATGWDPFRDASTFCGTLYDEDDLDPYTSNEAFPEVPSSLLRPSRWQTVSMGRWRDTSESITIKEGRALVLAMRRLTRSQQYRGLRHVVLLDNLALCFAVGKGRCHGFALLRVLQQLSALSLASGIILRPRWIPSESNLADGPSRGQLEPGAYHKDWGIWSGEEINFKSSQSDSSKVPFVDSKNYISQDGDRISKVEEAFPYHSKSGCCTEGPKGSSYHWEDSKGRRSGLGQSCTIQQVDSTIEARSVSVEIQHQNQTYLDKFVAFCRGNGIPWPVPLGELDATLADHLDMMFLDGKSPSEGEKTVAAVEFLVLRSKGLLVRCKRSLKGWRKTMPASSRLPLPCLIMYGIAMNMAASELKHMSLMTVLAFFLYLRPGEAVEVRGKNIVPAVKGVGRVFKHVTVIIRDQDEEIPDKVGVFDNSLPIDQKELQWMAKLLVARAKKLNSPKDHIFQFSMEEFRTAFSAAGERLGLAGLHPYQLRHGGATNDLASRLRDFPSVKSRGRWKSDQSVRRYAKTGRVQRLLSKLSQVNLNFCKWAEVNLGKVLQGLTTARASNP